MAIWVSCPQKARLVNKVKRGGITKAGNGRAFLIGKFDLGSRDAFVRGTSP
jgi:hypothetical protein